MAVKLKDVVTTTTIGIKNPATLAKFPEGGGTAQVSLSGGTSPTATIQLRAWVISSNVPEILATFVLPVPSGEKIGQMFDSLPVFTVWDDFDWNVSSLTGGGTLDLGFVGIGA